VDLAAVARGCGIDASVLVETLDDFRAALDRALGAPGPHVVVAKVDRTLAEGWTPRRPPMIAYRFMGRLGTLPDVKAMAWE
jgi:thiamine pyrophosphate-dependent acetolactate synthase large subunit-like protein